MPTTLPLLLGSCAYPRTTLSAVNGKPGHSEERLFLYKTYDDTRHLNGKGRSSDEAPEAFNSTLPCIRLPLATTLTLQASWTGQSPADLTKGLAPASSKILNMATLPVVAASRSGVGPLSSTKTLFRSIPVLTRRFTSALDCITIARARAMMLGPAASKPWTAAAGLESRLASERSFAGNLIFRLGRPGGEQAPLVLSR